MSLACLARVNFLLQTAVIYATADEADAYIFYRCLFLFFLFFFVFFRSPQNTRQPFSGTAERIFMKLLPNDSGHNSFQRSTEMGARPPINFGGLKTTHCALGGDAWRELVCWLWHCAATAAALKRHEHLI